MAGFRRSWDILQTVVEAPPDPREPLELKLATAPTLASPNQGEFLAVKTLRVPVNLQDVVMVDYCDEAGYLALAVKNGGLGNYDLHLLFY